MTASEKGMTVAEANAKHAGTGKTALGEFARVTVAKGDGNKSKGATPSNKPLGLGFKAPPRITELTAQKAESAATLEMFRTMRGDHDNDPKKGEEARANSIPWNVVETMGALYQVLTIEDEDMRNSRDVVDNEKACRAALKGLIDLSSVSGLDRLSPQQKFELSGVARLAAYKKAVELVCPDGSLTIDEKFRKGSAPSFEALKKLTVLLFDLGVARKQRLEKEKVVVDGEEKTLDPDNLRAMQDRVVNCGLFTIVVNARGTDVKNWRDRHQAAWIDIQNENSAKREAAQNELKGMQTISFAEGLSGAEGIAVVFAPKGERTVPYVNPVTKKREGTKQVTDSAVNLALKFEHVKEKREVIDSFVSVVRVAGNERTGERFEQIMHPQGPKPRGFLLSDIASIDPRTMQGSWEEVEGKVGVTPAPLPFVKNRTDAEREYQGDQKVVWGAIQRAMTYAFSPKGETAALRKEGDVHAKNWAEGVVGRATLFQKWSVNRIYFAATRHEDGTISFEIPGRLKVFFIGMESGKKYAADDIPDPMKSVLKTVTDSLLGVKKEENAPAFVELAAEAAAK